MTKRIGLYPGTFDPLTIGHVDIVRRAVKLVDELVIGVAVNRDKGPLFSLKERVAMVGSEMGPLGKERGVVIKVRPFESLLTHFADEIKADIIIRGLRAVSDFEYEFQMVGMNQALNRRIEALQAIQELGLELQVIFNKDAVMVLPTGINKATGMEYALRKLGLSPHEAVGIGDAENDHSFLTRCECAVAVANAAPSIRKLAAFVTKRQAGQGVAELIDELIADDLSRTYGRLIKNLITIGTRSDGTAVTVAPYGLNILIAGPSGSGKSTVTAAVIERLMERTYQLCIVDPEGDYGTLPEVFTIGNQHHAVTVTEVLAFLEDTKVNINVNLLGIPLADRPLFFAQLLPNLQAMRTRTGRPHWIVLDEAHHMIPAEWSHLDKLLPHKLGETVLVTVHPDHLASMALSLVDVAIAVGRSPRDTLKQIGDALGRTLEWPEGLSYQPGKVVVWFPHRGEPPFSMSASPGRAEPARDQRAGQPATVSRSVQSWAWTPSSACAAARPRSAGCS